MKEKKGFGLRDIAGQKVIVAESAENINFGKVIAMNNSSAYLWEALQGKEFDAQVMADLLTQKYEVEVEKALADSQKLIEAWKNAGIIE
ncbi:MAG: PqqD family protein [Paludibacteraceae bacterium]|nr:PqqD family protein [Paludibacteraceae bacterium]